ncbi:hypothetical protein [Jiulongibacter sp. NS-SX5]|uniref:hypothetical protein n=1 Tax=Jiulongibacter sp. NS-SX5 TaxID=3463854 RepID=UPI004058368A
MADYLHTESRDQSLVGQVGRIVELHKQKTLLNLADKSANTLGAISVKLVVVFLGLLTIMMLCLGMAAFLNDIMNSPYWGFVIMGVVLGFFTYLLILKGKSWLTDLFSNEMLELFYHHKEDEDEDDQ